MSNVGRLLGSRLIDLHRVSSNIMPCAGCHGFDRDAVGMHARVLLSLAPGGHIDQPLPSASTAQAAGFSTLLGLSVADRMIAGSDGHTIGTPPRTLRYPAAPPCDSSPLPRRETGPAIHGRSRSVRCRMSRCPGAGSSARPRVERGATAPCRAHPHSLSRLTIVPLRRREPPVVDRPLA